MIARTIIQDKAAGRHLVVDHTGGSYIKNTRVKSPGNQTGGEVPIRGPHEPGFAPQLPSSSTVKILFMEESPRYEMATFAAGCFWDVEAEFRRRDGVIETRVGYTGGSLPEPGYEQVSSGTTGHAEAVQLIFDPEQVSYDQLLDLFWSIHDPFHNHESRTRSAIFYHSREQKTMAEASRDCLQSSAGIPILTDILPFGKFWKAEDCHQQYYEKCSQGYCTSTKYWE